MSPKITGYFPQNYKQLQIKGSTQLHNTSVILQGTNTVPPEQAPASAFSYTVSSQKKPLAHAMKNKPHDVKYTNLPAFVVGSLIYPQQLSMNLPDFGSSVNCKLWFIC